MKHSPLIAAVVAIGLVSSCATMPQHPPRCSGEGAMRPVNPDMITPKQEKDVKDGEAKKLNPILQFLMDGQAKDEHGNPYPVTRHRRAGVR